MTGTTVGNYRILRELGAGGMGAVYEAVDLVLERPVALKMLRPEIAAQPELIERFRAEAVTLAKLNHPCIATLFSFFHERGQYCMVMELVRGRSLEALLKESGPLPPHVAAGLLHQTLDGMAHAHAMGVLHRDIKPANIMVTPDGTVKVTDFGIARILGASRMTREGRIIGTLEYIAPERIRGDEADVRSDLYSAGVVLYEMLAGRPPFASDTDFDLMQAHLSQQPPPMSGLGVACPPELEAIVGKALAKQPAARFQSAQEFRDVLVISAPTLKPTRLAATPPPDLKPTRLAGAPPPTLPGPDYKPPILLLAGIAAMLTLGIAGLFVLRHLTAPAPQPKVAVSAPAPASAPAITPEPAPAQVPVPIQPPVTLPPELQKLTAPASAPTPTPAAQPITLRAIRKLYVEPMPSDLDKHIRREIREQMPGRLAVVSDREDADAVMRGSAARNSDLGGKLTGGYLGMKSEFTGRVTITDPAGERVLWTSEAGDSTAIIGVLKRGGPKKVAERLVSSLRKALHY
jgi:serine/threonine protein kinase